jgi:hypothetical protein
VFVFLFLALEGLLGGEGHGGEAHGGVDAQIDDAGGFADEVEIVAIGDGDEGDAEEVVFGDDFADIEAIVKALDAVDRRAAADLLGREDAIAAQSEVAGDLGDEFGEVIGDGRLIELTLVEEMADMEAPFRDDFLLAGGEDIGKMRYGAVSLKSDRAQPRRFCADRYGELNQEFLPGNGGPAYRPPQERRWLPLRRCSPGLRS